MVNCAVALCKRRSATSNLREHGISYHQFPKNPMLREQWTKFCCQKLSWYATRMSVMCSEHFTPESFQTLANNRRKLVDGAMPTLKACQGMENVNSPTIISAPLNVANPGLHRENGSAGDIHGETEPSSSASLSESRIRKLKAQLHLKNIKIHRLQSKTRYLQKKVDTLEEILKKIRSKTIANILKTAKNRNS